MPPRNSAEVAIKLYDKARQLGLAVKMECSLVARSDSRYIILFPGCADEAVIRISSHKPSPDRVYALAIDARRLETAVQVGTAYLEKTYGPDRELHAPAPRRGVAATDIHQRRRLGDGPVQRRRVQALQRPDEDLRDWVRRRGPGRVRAAGPKPKWLSREARGVRDEWDWDD